MWPNCSGTMKSDPEFSPSPGDTDWPCHGWSDHAHGRREQSDRMSFRERLEWLEAATAFAGLLAAAPVVPAPAWARRGREAPPQAIAEKQAAYEAGMPAKDKRAEGTPPTEA